MAGKWAEGEKMYQTPSGMEKTRRGGRKEGKGKYRQKLPSPPFGIKCNLLESSVDRLVHTCFGANHLFSGHFEAIFTKLVSK